MKKDFIKKIFIVTVLIMFALFAGCKQKADVRTPHEVTKTVANKILNETTFDFKFVQQETELDVQFVDFHKTFTHTESGIGYALSYIISEKDTSILFGLSSSGRIKIWINDKLAFRQADDRTAEISEIAYDRFTFQDSFRVKLNKGPNKVLVKVASNPEQWIFFLRPITSDGDEGETISFSLDPVAPEITSVDWLCVGTFPYPTAGSSCERMDVVYPPERGFCEYYKFEDRVYSWEIPKSNILLELVIDLSNTYKRSSYIDWRYENGAMMLGLLALADETGEKRYTDYVRRFCEFILKHHEYFKFQYQSLHAFRGSYHKLFRRTMLDDTGAPALPFVEMYIREQKVEYGKLIEQIAEYVNNQQVRLSDRTFCRPEPAPMTVWADDLFMSVPFLLRMGKITGKMDYFDDAARQIIQFHEKLFDHNKGLFYHGWYESAGHTSVAHWGRANGWIIWAVSEALTYLPTNHPEYQKVLSVFRNHVRGLSEHQDPSGMWHQILDHPESYEETSCTAMFVLGIARGINNGWIEEKYRENALKGWKAIKKKIDNDGTVHGTCEGTGIGDNLEFYFNRSRYANDPRGLGSVMTAGIEVSKFFEK